MAPVPPGAQLSTHLAARAIAQTPLHASCTPLHYATSEYTSPQTGPAIQHYLLTHPGPHLRQRGSGYTTHQGITTAWTVTLEPPNQPSFTQSTAHQSLIYDIAPLPHGTGIRIDAEVISPHARCIHSDPALPTS